MLHARGSRAIVAFVGAAFLLGACSPPRSAEASSESACVADSISTLRLLPTVPGCATKTWLCRAKCMGGNGASCLGLAYHLQRDSKTAADATPLFRRACALGVANGCTNYAAAFWANDGTDAEWTCAVRTFEKACAAKERFACGMVGRVMLESSTPPSIAEGRKYLEKTCQDLGGFPCRVLAKHLESGKVGAYDPRDIRTLLARACAGGDPDACGEPATASETFQ